MKIRPIHVERHELGPRLRVFGRRVHEWTVGAALVAIWAHPGHDILALGGRRSPCGPGPMDV
jgi:hypothetical protein